MEISKLSEKFAILVIEVLGHIPLSVRAYLGSATGYIAYKFAKRERKIAELQLQKILKINNSKKITAQIFRFFAINLWQTLNLFPILDQHETKISINNQDLWNDLINYPKPIIALTGHTGNWDLLAAYVVKRGAKIVTVGRMARGSISQSILKHLREKYQIKTIWRKSLKDTRELLMESSKGTIMAVLIDQDIKAKGINSNFFGLPCKTPTALLELGLKVDARIVSAFMFQEPNGTYQLYLNEISAELSISQIVSQYHQDLENLLLRYPEQWVWFHKRWRTNIGIDGSLVTMSSKEYLDYLQKL